MLGTATEMGLPHPNEELYTVLPRKVSGQTCVTTEGFDYYADDEQGPGSWQEATITFGEAVPLVFTTNCTESNWDTNNQFHPKLGTAAILSGSVIKKRKAGVPTKLEWWVN